jgi:hypothetical protein
MKVLLSVAVWGKDYVSTFADFSLATLLSPGNIPKLARQHKVTFQIVTTKPDAQELRRRPVFRALGKYCKVAWNYIEDCGYNPMLIPREGSGDKYPFVSRLQNLAIAKSLAYDALVFNYADFVWADGSLYNAIGLLRDGVDAVRSFCLPVDMPKGKQALLSYRSNQDAAQIIDLQPRVGAGIAIDCLHREAMLRFWEGPRFTQMPTYLLWPVANEGLLVRAYHQTVLAMRVQRDNPEYVGGIRYGTLDGYFTGQLAKNANFHCAADSDDVLVFSLFDGKSSSAVRDGRTREQVLRDCLRTAISEPQRRFAETPIYVKRSFHDHALWDRTADASWQELALIQLTTAADDEAYDSSQIEISVAEAFWRLKAYWFYPRWFYERILLTFASGWPGYIIKRALGKGRARSVRVILERWLLRRGNGL